MTNHNIAFEDLEDQHASRRERKKRPRMKKHGQHLKKSTKRSALHILKVERKKDKNPKHEIRNPKQIPNEENLKF